MYSTCAEHIFACMLVLPDFQFSPSSNPYIQHTANSIRQANKLTKKTNSTTQTGSDKRVTKGKEEEQKEEEGEGKGQEKARSDPFFPFFLFA